MLSFLNCECFTFLLVSFSRRKSKISFVSDKHLELFLCCSICNQCNQRMFLIDRNLLFSDSDYISFKELYYPDSDENDPLNALDSYQKLLIQHRNKQNGPKYRKLSERLACSCGRRFSYLAGYRYHVRHECGKVLQCKFCGKVYSDKSNLVKHSNVCRYKS